MAGSNEVNANESKVIHYTYFALNSGFNLLGSDFRFPFPDEGS